MDFTQTIVMTGAASGVLAILVFVAFWGGVVHLVAYMSGWKRAAEEFAMQEWDEFPDDRITYGSLQIGNSNYNNSVTIAVNDMGIYLRTIWLFRMGHKPLFIPWTAVYEVQKNPIAAYWQKLKITGGQAASTIGTLTSLARGHGLMGDSYRIVVGNPSVFTFMIGGRSSKRWNNLLESKMTVRK